MKNTIQTPIDLRIEFEKLKNAGITHIVKHEPNPQLIWRIDVINNIAGPSYERLFAKGRVITRNKKAKNYGFKYNADRKIWELQLTQAWHRIALSKANVQFSDFFVLDSTAVWEPLEMKIKITARTVKATVICAS